MPIVPMPIHGEPTDLELRRAATRPCCICGGPIGYDCPFMEAGEAVAHTSCVKGAQRTFQIKGDDWSPLVDWLGPGWVPSPVDDELEPDEAESATVHNLADSCPLCGWDLPQRWPGTNDYIGCLGCGAHIKVAGWHQ